MEIRVPRADPRLVQLLYCVLRIAQFRFKIGKLLAELCAQPTDGCMHIPLQAVGELLVLQSVVLHVRLQSALYQAIQSKGKGQYFKLAICNQTRLNTFI